MPRSNRAEDSAADFTIRSIFSAKFLAAAEEESAEPFSKHFSAAWPDKGRIDNGARICGTTCKLRWKKPRLAPKRKSKSKSWMRVTSAMAQAQSQDRARLIVRFVAVAARWSVRADFFRCRKRVRVVAASVTLSKNRVAHAMAKGAM